LFAAVEHDRLSEVKEILRNNPNVNVNWKNQDDYGFTALHAACWEGHDSIVSLLLAHPDIDVNLKDKDGWTPFLISCYQGQTCDALLLDSRVKVNEPAKDGSTPLWHAAHFGHLETIKWWIVSGREMDLGTPGNDRRDTIGKATERGENEIVELLGRFKTNPEQTRHEVRQDPTARPSNLRTALLNSSSRVPTTRTIQNILHRGGPECMQNEKEAEADEGAEGGEA